MSQDSDSLRFGDRDLDVVRRELREAGKPTPLQPTPLRVLLYLAAHRDRTVPRRELLDAITGPREEALAEYDRWIASAPDTLERAAFSWTSSGTRGESSKRSS